MKNAGLCKILKKVFFFSFSLSKWKYKNIKNDKNIDCEI